MKIQVLDHGYVESIEPWGGGRHGLEDYNEFESGIIEAARQSTQGSFRGWDTDQKLLAFLHDNNHATPFEFAGLVIEVQAPIFVFREWHRHRTQSYNEMSARYAPLPDLCYVPDYDNVMERILTATVNKQAGVVNVPRESITSDVRHWIENIRTSYDEAEKLYKDALEEGIPKELARLVMPVGHYSRMRAHANLRCWLQFLLLRMDPRAQWEIRQFANAVGQLIKESFPRTWALFQEKHHDL